MVLEPLKPKRGGFLRSVGLGLFIRDYLLGRGPLEAPRIDPAVGSYQADIFYQYKMVLIRTTAVDRATRIEEKHAKKEKLIEEFNIYEDTYIKIQKLYDGVPPYLNKIYEELKNILFYGRNV